MADYNAYPGGYFLGNVETFEFTAAADVAENSLIKEGSLIGFTRQAFRAGEKGVAFLAGKTSHYNIELATSATDPISQGTDIYITAEGKATTTSDSNALIGCLYQAVGVGDAFADVLIYHPMPTTP